MKMIKNLASLSSLVPKAKGKTARTVVATPAANVLSALLWLSLLCASAPQSFAQGGIPLWINYYNEPPSFDDVAYATAVDSNGNVFVTGFSMDVFGNGFGDYATVAYSGTGVPLWTNRYDGPGNSDDYAYAMAVDSSGNVFVTGESYGSTSAYDYATIKYSSAGVALWINRYNGPGNSSDSAYAMAVDSSGNVIVTGQSYGGPNTYHDYATIKYSSAGVGLWTNRYDGGDDYATAVAVDSSGNVFVTGRSHGGTNTDYDYATIKYSSAGVALWTNRYNGGANGSDTATAMAVDSSGNVVVTGQSYGGTNTGYDYVTIKYSSAGVALWTNCYNGPGNGSDIANAMAVDSSGNVFVTGSSIGNNAYYDYATIKYSSAGVALWTNRYDGGANDIDTAKAVAVDGSGNVFVTGSSIGDNTFYDYATIGYSSAGVALWTNRYDGNANGADSANAMAVDSSGNVFVTGGNSYYDYVTIKYSSSLTPPSLTIRRTGSTSVAVSWPASASNFVLQQNTNSLSSINWSNITSDISNDGTTKTLVIDPALGTRFYRLVIP